MTIDADRLLLIAAFSPYVGVALYDGWLHEKARRVPRLEQALHALAFAAVSTLWWALWMHRAGWALAALIVFACTAGFDEFGYHGPLDRHERRIHAVAYLCFAGFAAVAWRLGGFG